MKARVAGVWWRWWRWWGWLAVITVGVKADRLKDQIFATMPSHQTAVLGSTAVLPCRVVNRRGLVQWTRDGFGLGTDRELEGFTR